MPPSLSEPQSLSRKSFCRGLGIRDLWILGAHDQLYILQQSRCGLTSKRPARSPLPGHSRRAETSVVWWLSIGRPVIWAPFSCFQLVSTLGSGPSYQPRAVWEGQEMTLGLTSWAVSNCKFATYRNDHVSRLQHGHLQVLMSAGMQEVKESSKRVAASGLCT